MLVYMSSYPRAGSSLLQQFINYAFQKPWSGVDIPEKPLPEITGVPEYFTNWRYCDRLWRPSSPIQKAISKLNKLTLKRYKFEDWIAYYDLAVPPYTQDCQYLLPGCFHFLTPSHRQQLASRDELFFIKTHYMPYEQYFEGECVVQMTRHPGPTFVSYTKLLKTRGHASSLEDIILGKVRFGAWSKWHQAWQKAAQELGDRYVYLKYEEVLNQKIMACDAIKSVIHCDYISEGISNMPSFEILKSQVPQYYGVGKSDGWESQYTSEQKRLFYDLHGDLMLQLGYQ